MLRFLASIAAKKREQCGYLVFEEDYQAEISKKAYERVIDFTILEGKAAEIFTAIKNREFDFQYMCESIAATGNYSSSRAIMILAEFEREYLNIFGQDYKRITGISNNEKKPVGYNADLYRAATRAGAKICQTVLPCNRITRCRLWRKAQKCDG